MVDLMLIALISYFIIINYLRFVFSFNIFGNFRVRFYQIDEIKRKPKREREREKNGKEENFI